MPKNYSIRDLAREFDITTRSIRFYEEKGLLSPTRQGTNRVFSAADHTRLKLILRGKRLGLTLQESSDIINMYDPATGSKKQLQALLQKIRERILALHDQQQDLELMLTDLRASEVQCLEALGEKSRRKSA